MASAKMVKASQLSKLTGDVNMASIFDEMTGVKDADPDIIIPKFVTARNMLRYIYRVLKQFCDMISKDFPTFQAGLDEIRKFAEDMKESVYLKHDHDEKESIYDTVDKTAINDLWRKLKENTHVKAIIIMCSKLTRYHSNFANKTEYRENFVNQEPGLTFMIFDFSSLDLKSLWANDRMTSIIKNYILTVFNILYKHSHALYKCVTSPDVDVDQFTGLLMNSIGELKKNPRLCRCKNAFKRIEDSVDLLKDKFEDYYRESVASENTNIIVTNFIVDVSNQGGTNASLTREFRIIIQYMHEVSQQSSKSQDPNVKKVFAMLKNNFALMDKHNEAKRAAKAEEKASDSKLEAAADLDAEQIAKDKEARRLEKARAKKKRKSNNKKKKANEEQENGEQEDEEEADENHPDEQLDQTAETQE